MTETEIRAYLIEAYTRGVIRAREEYRWHPNNACPPQHRCPYRLARKTR